MPRRCVFGCITAGVTIHDFPNPTKDPERFKQWVQIVGEPLTGLSEVDIYGKKKVCAKHFTGKDWNRNSRLNALAVPSLHISRMSRTTAPTYKQDNSGTVNTHKKEVTALQEHTGANNSRATVQCTDKQMHIKAIHNQDDDRRFPKDEPPEQRCQAAAQNTPNKKNVSKPKSGGLRLIVHTGYSNYLITNTEYHSNGSDTDYDGDTSLQNSAVGEDDLCTQKIKKPTEISKCKCCMGSGKLRSMWQQPTDGDLQEYGTMLIDCFALPWSKPDDPKRSADKICESCIERLKDAVSFKREVLASERLLSAQQAECDKSNDDQDEDSVQFEDTEYLDYEYLELDADSGDEAPGDERGDSVGDTLDTSAPICVKEETERASQLVTSFRKRKQCADVGGAGGTSPAVKRVKGSNKDSSNTKTNESKTQLNEMRSMKIIGYLEDILRYSNATPIGGVTPEGFHCSYCTDKYDGPAALKHHTLDKHADKVTVSPTDDHIKLDITNLKCLDCYADVDSLHGFVRHMQLEHQMKMRRGKHSALVPFKFESMVFKCAVCDKSFIRFDKLDKHMRVHFDNGNLSNFNISQKDDYR